MDMVSSPPVGRGGLKIFWVFQKGGGRGFFVFLGGLRKKGWGEFSRGGGPGFVAHKTAIFHLSIFTLDALHNSNFNFYQYKVQLDRFIMSHASSESN